jgi:DNA-binding NarL/FixJ family response regulator
VTVSTLSESKSDNGRQRLQRAVIEFLLLEGGAGEEGRDTPPERVRLSCVLSRFDIQMDQRSSPRQGRTAKQGRPGRSDRHETDAAIQLILQGDTNDPLRTIAETLSISPETVRTQMSRIRDTLKTSY